MNEHWYVIVLTRPGRDPILSHASLMTFTEAEHEAETWRRTDSGLGKWHAEIMVVA